MAHKSYIVNAGKDEEMNVIMLAPDEITSHMTRASHIINLKETFPAMKLDDPNDIAAIKVGYDEG